MTLQEITSHYVKVFKKGPLSSETRKAYETLKRLGEATGQDLTNTFFKNMFAKYSEEPHQYEDMTENELNRAILFQYQCYMQHFKDTDNERKEISSTGKNRRRSEFEIK